MRAVPRPPFVFVLIVLLLAVSRPAPAQVTIRATSTTVGQQGDLGQICVMLETNGATVAGTQNDLNWDGTCASLPGDQSACFAAGAHGKQMQAGVPRGADFGLRVLMLSLSDVDPMPDGPLYCCRFQSEASPGSCCRISVVRAGASDPGGTAISARGVAGEICTAKDSGGRGIGDVIGGGAGLGGPGGTDTGFGAPGSGSQAAQPGAAAPVAPPAAQVLQGGGAGAPTPVAPAPGAPAGGATAAATVAVMRPTGPAEPARGLTPGQPSAASSASAATAEPTPAATTPAAAAPTAVRDTPTRVAALRPTARAAAATPRAEESDADGGWFGCHIGGGSAMPLLALGAVFGVLALVFRRPRAPQP